MDPRSVLLLGKAKLAGLAAAGVIGAAAVGALVFAATDGGGQAKDGGGEAKESLLTSQTYISK